MHSLIFFLIAIGTSYVVGSLCSAVVVSNLCSLPDPRTEGSQNPGATNVLRLSGKKYAFIVLLADMLKGFFPVILFKIFGASPFVQGFIALAAVLGHIFPLFFKFKGGKGVATGLGTVLALNWMLGLIICGIWILVAAISRYSSLASLVAVSAIPILANFFHNSINAFFPLLMMTFCILIKHKENFSRLQAGEESKINFNERL